MTRLTAAGTLSYVFDAKLCMRRVHVVDAFSFVLLLQAKTVLREKVAPKKRHEQVD